MLEGLRGATSLDQLRTPSSARKRLNWSPTFQCPSLFVRSSVSDNNSNNNRVSRAAPQQPVLLPLYAESKSQSKMILFRLEEV